MVFWTGKKKLLMCALAFIAIIFVLFYFDDTTKILNFNTMSLTFNDLAIGVTFFGGILACSALWGNVKQEKMIKNSTIKHIDSLFLSCEQIGFYQKLIQKTQKEFEKMKLKMCQEVTFESYITNSFELITMDFASKLSTNFFNQVKVVPDNTISEKTMHAFLQYLILANDNHFSYLSKRIKDKYEHEIHFSNLYTAYYNPSLTVKINKSVLSFVVFD
jgi:hypothetical protein